MFGREIKHTGSNIQEGCQSNRVQYCAGNQTNRAQCFAGFHARRSGGEGTVMKPSGPNISFKYPPPEGNWNRRKWRSHPSGRFSQERLTRGTVTSAMRWAAHPSGCARCGACSCCSAIDYRSPRPREIGTVDQISDGKSQILCRSKYCTMHSSQDQNRGCAATLLACPPTLPPCQLSTRASD